MLTPKQELFARYIIEGASPSEAYKAAGYKAGKPETVAKEAQKLLNHPHIAPMIEEARKKARRESGWKLSEAIRETQLIKDLALCRLRAGEWDSLTIRTYFDALDRLNRYTDAEAIVGIRRESFAKVQNRRDNFRVMEDDDDSIEHWLGMPSIEEIENQTERGKR